MWSLMTHVISADRLDFRQNFDHSTSITRPIRVILRGLLDMLPTYAVRLPDPMGACYYPHNEILYDGSETAGECSIPTSFSRARWISEG